MLLSWSQRVPPAPGPRPTLQGTVGHETQSYGRSLWTAAAPGLVQQCTCVRACCGGSSSSVTLMVTRRCLLACC